MRHVRLLSGAGLALAAALIAAGCGTTTVSNAGHPTSPAAVSSQPATASNVSAAAQQASGLAPAFTVTATDGQIVTVPSDHTTVLYFMAA